MVQFKKKKEKKNYLYKRYKKEHACNYLLTCRKVMGLKPETAHTSSSRLDGQLGQLRPARPSAEQLLNPGRRLTGQRLLQLATPWYPLRRRGVPRNPTTDRATLRLGADQASGPLVRRCNVPELRSRRPCGRGIRHRHRLASSDHLHVVQPRATPQTATRGSRQVNRDGRETGDE